LEKPATDARSSSFRARREQGARPRGVCTWLLPQKLDPIVSMDDSPTASVAVAAAPSSMSPRSAWWVRERGGIAILSRGSCEHEPRLAPEKRNPGV
jgi:hypothetical protein